MCQQTTDMGLNIEQLYLQGMPRKIGRTVQVAILKKKDCIMCSGRGDSDGLSTDRINKCTCVRKQSGSSDHKVKSYKDDILAIGTQWTRSFVRMIMDIGDKIQKTTTYKVLSKTTQPAHVIALGILSFVLIAVWPNLLESDSENIERPKSNGNKSGLALLAYLGAFATHFGAQIWMTFVSGLSLYFALPRHTFGLCQQILFPKYFALNSVLSICTLVMFIKVIGGRWEFASYVQVIALTICAVIEVVVRLYLAPPLLRLMREKHKFEIKIGSGKEVGYLQQGELLNCPHYQKIHKSFRRIHMTVAMGNLTALVCTFLHLHYLASKITVVS